MGEELADKYRMLVALFNLAVGHSLTGNRQKAVQLYSQSIDMINQTGEKFWKFNIIGNLYGEADIAGDYASMERIVGEVIQVTHDLENRLPRFGRILVANYQARFSADLGRARTMLE